MGGYVVPEPDHGPQTCRDRSHERVVICLQHNHSAFNSYRWTASDYSMVACRNCGLYWRTRADYVNDLPVHGCNGGPADG